MSDAPADDASVDDAPVDDAAVDDAPVENAAADDASDDRPGYVGEAPNPPLADQGPRDGTPAEDAG